MKRLVKRVVTLAAAALMSGTAIAAINFTDDFESYDLYIGPGYQGDVGGGWLAFANVFGDYPGCTEYWYGYGAFPTPNKDSGFSNISEELYGQALTTFSDYENGNHADGACIETSVFQETVFTAADADTYEFRFYAGIPGELGAGVSTYGFVKLLNPATGYSTDVFETVSTELTGLHSIEITLDASADGKILQWGFGTVASNYEPSGRWYDNVSFTPKSVAPPFESLYDNPIPIPFWALMGMAGLLAYIGGSRLRNRRKA